MGVVMDLGEAIGFFHRYMEDLGTWRGPGQAIGLFQRCLGSLADRMKVRDERVHKRRRERSNTRVQEYLNAGPTVSTPQCQMACLNHQGKDISDSQITRHPFIVVSQRYVPSRHFTVLHHRSWNNSPREYGVVSSPCSRTRTLDPMIDTRESHTPSKSVTVPALSQEVPIPAKDFKA